jgi:hypothetical protein
MQTPESSPQSNQNSPLAEVDETSLNELMNRDPLSLADSDIDKIAEALRAQRKHFAQTEAEGKRPTKPKKAASVKEEFKLDDLI